MKDLSGYDTGALAEAFILFLEAMGGILPQINVVSPDPWVVDQTCTPENRQVVRVVLALCASVCAAAPQRLDAAVAYFVPSLVAKRLDAGPLREIAATLVQYARGVGGLDEELACT